MRRDSYIGGCPASYFPSLLTDCVPLCVPLPINLSRVMHSMRRVQGRGYIAHYAPGHVLRACWELRHPLLTQAKVALRLVDTGGQ